MPLLQAYTNCRVARKAHPDQQKSTLLVEIQCVDGFLLQVCHKRGKVEQWFEGTITEHHPEAALPFVVLFEDGDCYSGSFGAHVLRTKGKDHLYKFLDGDTERARLTQGATENSSPPSEPEVAAQRLPAPQGTPSSPAAASESPSAQDTGTQSDSVPDSVPSSSDGASELSTAPAASKQLLQTAVSAAGPVADTPPNQPLTVPASAAAVGVAETQTAPRAMLPSHAGFIWGNFLMTHLAQATQSGVAGVAPAAASEADAASREPALPAAVPGTDEDVKPLTQVKAELPVNSASKVSPSLCNTIT